MTDIFAKSSGIANIHTVADIPLSQHTTFKIGGCCDMGVFPENAEEFATAVAYFDEQEIPYYVIGRGSNLLADDNGFRGAVIFTDSMSGVSIADNRITASAGAGLTSVSRKAGAAGLSGFEFACGIPGSIGGGVVMNAGAYGGEIGDVIEKCTVYRRGKGIITCSRADGDFSYRHTAFLENRDFILDATFVLGEDSPEQIKEREEELLLRRREKQPLEFPSAGSAFKRPEGYFAAKLIEDAGLKGFSVGDAQVSEKHSGFIINRGKATSKDMLTLFREVRERVYALFGVLLESEVRYLSPKGEETI